MSIKKISAQEMLERKEKSEEKERIKELEKKCSEYYLEARGKADDMEILCEEKERLRGYNRELLEVLQELSEAMNCSNYYQKAYAKLRAEVIVKEINEAEEYDFI